MLVSMSYLFYEPNYVHIQYIYCTVKIVQSIFRLSHYNTREAVKMQPSEILDSSLGCNNCQIFNSAGCRWEKAMYFWLSGRPPIISYSFLAVKAHEQEINLPSLIDHLLTSKKSYCVYVILLIDRHWEYF